MLEKTFFESICKTTNFEITSLSNLEKNCTLENVHKEMKVFVAQSLEEINRKLTFIEKGPEPIKKLIAGNF